MNNHDNQIRKQTLEEVYKQLAPISHSIGMDWLKRELSK